MAGSLSQGALLVTKERDVSEEGDAADLAPKLRHQPFSEGAGGGGDHHRGQDPAGRKVGSVTRSHAPQGCGQRRSERTAPSWCCAILLPCGKEVPLAVTGVSLPPLTGEEEIEAAVGGEVAEPGPNLCPL